jgi:hypothetical protein
MTDFRALVSGQIVTAGKGIDDNFLGEESLFISS